MAKMKIEFSDYWDAGIEGEYLVLRINAYSACTVRKVASVVYIMPCENGMELYSDIAGCDYPLKKLTAEEYVKIITWAEKYFNKEMNNYKVWYIIKKNHHGYLYEMTVHANNKKDAFRMVRNAIYKETGKHAFRCTCTVPKKLNYGLDGIVFDGESFPNYDPFTKELW